MIFCGFFRLFVCLGILFVLWWFFDWLVGLVFGWFQMVPMRQLLLGNHIYFLTDCLKHCSLKVQVLIRLDKCSGVGGNLGGESWSFSSWICFLIQIQINSKNSEEDQTPVHNQEFGGR